MDLKKGLCAFGYLFQNGAALDNLRVWVLTPILRKGESTLHFSKLLTHTKSTYGNIANYFFLGHMFLKDFGNVNDHTIRVVLTQKNCTGRLQVARRSFFLFGDGCLQSCG